MKVILSLSGGGARGIVIARILQRIEAITGKAIPQLFDFFAGTSTGAIIAAGLTTPSTPGSVLAYRYSAGDIFSLYQTNLPAIFANPRSLTSLLSGSRYDASPLESVLTDVALDYTIAESTKDILITAFDTVRMQPIVFTKDGPYSSTLIRDAVRASSAAPTFFPPKVLGDKNLVDGAIACLNNPSVAALSHASKIYDAEDPIVLVSISCGEVQASEQLTAGFSNAETSGWGALGWILSLSGSPIISMLMAGSELESHFQMQELLPVDADRNLTRYWRLSVPLPAAVMSKLDDASPSNISYLISTTDLWLKQTEINAKINALCSFLLANYDLLNDERLIISSTLTVEPPFDVNWFIIPDANITSNDFEELHPPSHVRPNSTGFQGGGSQGGSLASGTCATQLYRVSGGNIT